jgi:hypothetical protein
MWKPVAGEDVVPLPVNRVASTEYFNVPDDQRQLGKKSQLRKIPLIVIRASTSEILYMPLFVSSTFGESRWRLQETALSFLYYL